MRKGRLFPGGKHGRRNQKVQDYTWLRGGAASSLDGIGRGQDVGVGANVDMDMDMDMEVAVDVDVDGRRRDSPGT